VPSDFERTSLIGIKLSGTFSLQALNKSTELTLVSLEFCVTFPFGHLPALLVAASQKQAKSQRCSQFAGHGTDDSSRGFGMWDFGESVILHFLRCGTSRSPSAGTEFEPELRADIGRARRAFLLPNGAIAASGQRRPTAEGPDWLLSLALSRHLIRQLSSRTHFSFSDSFAVHGRSDRHCCWVGGRLLTLGIMHSANEATEGPVPLFASYTATSAR
jgi:hypothetical protein